MIQCANPLLQYLSYKNEIDRAISGVLNGGRYILGEEVRAFEKEFADYIGVSCGIGVGSGTEAIHLALAACGIGKGDEVITVSHTAVATVAAIELAGARPVFVDIDRIFFTLDPRKLEAAITPRTKAVIPVHLYGMPADLNPIREIAVKHGLRIIEDCSQAHGAIYENKRVGSYGDMACFSFYPTKNLGAVGDGGMVVTDRHDLCEKARLLREYGWAERYVSHMPGWNTRLDEIQAAVLRIKLQHLDEDNGKRAQLAKIYDRELAGLSGIEPPEKRKNSTHVYHLYVVRYARRDELQKHLKRHNIGVLVHYPLPVHLQPAYRDAIPANTDLTESERASFEVLSLPMYPELTETEVKSVTALIKESCQMTGEKQ